MKFLVVQLRQGKYRDVGRFAAATDALIFAAALLREPSPDYVSVKRTHKKDYAYTLFTATQPGPSADILLIEARANHAAQEKKWRREQREKKRAQAIRSAFIDRFNGSHWRALFNDRAFCAAYYAQPIREAEALARAAELGIYPTTAALTGELVAAH